MPMNHPKPLRRDRNFNAAPHGPRTESTGRMSKCKTTRDVVLQHVAFDVAPDTEVQRVFVSLITSLSARARPENDCPCHSSVSWTAPRADRRSKLSGVACHSLRLPLSPPQLSCWGKRESFTQRGVRERMEPRSDCKALSGISDWVDCTQFLVQTFVGTGWIPPVLGTNLCGGPLLGTI